VVLARSNPGGQIEDGSWINWTGRVGYTSWKRKVHVGGDNSVVVREMGKLDAGEGRFVSRVPKLFFGDGGYLGDA